MNLIFSICKLFFLIVFTLVVVQLAQIKQVFAMNFMTRMMLTNDPNTTRSFILNGDFELGSDKHWSKVDYGGEAQIIANSRSANPKSKYIAKFNFQSDKYYKCKALDVNSLPNREYSACHKAELAYYKPFGTPGHNATMVSDVWYKWSFMIPEPISSLTTTFIVGDLHSPKTGVTDSTDGPSPSQGFTLWRGLGLESHNEDPEKMYIGFTKKQWAKIEDFGTNRPGRCFFLNLTDESIDESGETVLNYTMYLPNGPKNCNYNHTPGIAVAPGTWYQIILHVKGERAVVEKDKDNNDIVVTYGFSEAWIGEEGSSNFEPFLRTEEDKAIFDNIPIMYREQPYYPRLGLYFVGRGASIENGASDEGEFTIFYDDFQATSSRQELKPNR